MGTRVKDFEATGVAPNGRLYAGDLNAIQDKYADQSNYSQSVDVASLAVGDGSLRLLKYGTAEGRFSGALRLDGILRGLGGLYAGAFTTAQRNAIPSGSRPYGLVILNSENNQYEWNKGSDATPNWLPLGTDPTLQGIPIGMTAEWPWAAATIPSWALMPYGQALSRATFATLHGLAQSSGYPYGNGDGSTTFNVMDHRGRVSAGKDDMGGTAVNRLTVAISGISGASLGAVGGVEGVTLTTGQIPAHNHPATGLTVTSHNHGGTTGNDSPDHAHTVAAHNHGGGNHYHTIPQQHEAGSSGSWSLGAARDEITGYDDTNYSGVIIATEAPATGGASARHAHSVGAEAPTVVGSTANTGGGAVVTNVQPTIVVNKIIRAL